MLTSSFRISYLPDVFSLGATGFHEPAQVMTHLLYKFALDRGYSFILYASPEDEGNSGKTTSIRGQRGQRGRRLRALISIASGEETELLNVRRFIPSEPGFVFAPYRITGVAGVTDNGENRDVSSENFSKHKLIAFSVDWVVELDTCKFGSRGRSEPRSRMLTGKWRTSQKNSERSKALIEDFLSAVMEQQYKTDKTDKTISHVPPYVKLKQSAVKISQLKFNTPQKTFATQVAQQVRTIKINEKSSEQTPDKILKKVVLSKVKTVALAPTFDWVDYFYRLLVEFPKSLVNFVADKSMGTWMGASPEILVSRTADKIFKTVSLAGTRWDEGDIGLKEQKVGKHSVTRKKSLLALPTHEVLWSEKEIQEQSVTSRFIIDCFKTLRLREYREEGPGTVRKGNLLHLQSEFSVDMKRYFGESLPYDMLALLHPTPAICGTPRNIAQKAIMRTELHPRSYYAGYLGPVEVDGEINVYVNLRCMEFLKQGSTYYARLYAGCGINAFSNPEQEWQETEAKLALLIDTLKPKNLTTKKAIQPRK